MVSTPSLFMRILQAVIQKVWTVLFFLTLLSALTVANHWWDTLANGYQALTNLILSGIDAIGR